MKRTVLLLAAAACGDSTAAPDALTTPDASPTKSVAVAFRATFGNTSFACGQTFADVGTPAAPFTGTDLRFFVHDVELISATGRTPVTLDANEFQRDGLALIDLETGAPACEQGTALVHAEVTGTVPNQAYTGLAFKLGVPFAMNHLDPATAAAPLNDTTMWWAWRGGYKFLKLDGASGMNPFFVHLGSTGCESGSPTEAPTAPCANPNVMAVELPTFDARTHTVELDLAALLADTDITTNAGGAPGCMSAPDDPECLTIFAPLGLPIAMQPAGTQAIFSAQ